MEGGQETMEGKVEDQTGGDGGARVKEESRTWTAEMTRGWRGRRAQDQRRIIKWGRQTS